MNRGRLALLALMLVAAAVSVGGSSARTMGDILGSGAVLYGGQGLVSANAGFQLWMQPDGNLVLYEVATNKVLWQSGTSGNAGAAVVMQTDGNLVVYSSGGTMLWNSGSPGNQGSHLAVQDDGNLVIYNPAGSAVWQAGSRATVPPASGGGSTGGSSGGGSTGGSSGGGSTGGSSGGGSSGGGTTGGSGGASGSGGGSSGGGSSGGGGSGSSTGVLASGSTLSSGQELRSANGAYLLAMQSDGNLVLYAVATNKTVWNAGTSGNAGAHATMQTDGNFVVYSTSGVALWNAGTPGNAGAHLAVQDDGNLVVYTASGSPVWQSGTAGAGSGSGGGTGTGGGASGGGTSGGGSSGSGGSPNTGVLASGATLSSGQELRSPNGAYLLTMQSDGNLVLTAVATNQVLWNSGTPRNAGAHATMQTDGNFVVYSASRVALWNSGTPHNDGAHLAVQNDGNVVVYAASGSWLWQSGTAGGQVASPPVTGSPAPTGGGGTPGAPAGAPSTGTDPEIWIGSPYNGSWASSDDCPDGARGFVQKASYPSEACSEPQYHHVTYAGYDGMPASQSWAADIGNVQQGTPVVLYAAPQSPSTQVTATVQGVAGACGNGNVSKANLDLGGYVVVVALYAGGVKVGTVAFAHVDPNVTQGQTIDRWGTTIGYVGSYRASRTNHCWTGVHTHVELGGAHHYACFNKGWSPGHPWGQQMSATNFLGFIGGARTSGPRQPCP